nr:gliding motility-associated C-terminal domain-containing protein [Bacteroidota bacterium]
IGVPNNDIGYQYAKTGQAYAGFYTYTGIFREYIQTPLIANLVPSQNYLVEFYVSLGDTFSIATHSIGLYFSDTAISTATSGAVINVTPQIANNVVDNQLIDKIGWTKISGTYVANGSEQFITIGNFLDDSSSDTTQLSEGSYPYSYYYIDDVSIICMDCPELQVDIFIPSFISGDDFFEIKGLSENNELLIFNSLGQIIFKEQNYSNSFSALQVNTGMYYYSLRLNDGNVHKGKLLVVN